MHEKYPVNQSFAGSFSYVLENMVEKSSSLDLFYVLQDFNTVEEQSELKS